jgi:hypothetical protein
METQFENEASLAFVKTVNLTERERDWINRTLHGTHEVLSCKLGFAAKDLRWDVVSHEGDFPGDWTIEVRGVRITRQQQWDSFTGKALLAIFACGFLALLVWGSGAVYAAMSLKLIVVVGIIAIVIAILAVRGGR